LVYSPSASGRHERERRFVRLLDEVKGEADVIVFLGDVFDYWYEYRYVAPCGFVRFLGKLSELSDSGVKLHFIGGNHDMWMGDYLRAELNAEVHDSPFVIELYGKRFFIAHGDEVGSRPFLYRCIQTVFRSPLCRRLYAAVHPRWTFAFAQRLSHKSRLKNMRRPDMAEAVQRNVQRLCEFALEYHQKHTDVQYFMFGHLHCTDNIEIAPDVRLVLTGEWIEKSSYAVWDGAELKVVE